MTEDFFKAFFGKALPVHIGIDERDTIRTRKVETELQAFAECEGCPSFIGKAWMVGSGVKDQHGGFAHAFGFERPVDDIVGGERLPGGGGGFFRRAFEKDGGVEKRLECGGTFTFTGGLVDVVNECHERIS